MKRLTIACALLAAAALVPAAARAGKEGKDYLGEGKKALDAGKWKEALALYTKAVTATKGSDAAMWGKGMVYVSQGDYQSAKKFCKGYINKGKKNPWAHSCMGYAQLVWKRSSLAAAAFGDALALDPGFAPALAGMGHAKVLTGSYKEAQESFRKALALDPAELEAVIGLVDLLVKEGKNAEALEVAEGAKAKHGEDPRFLVARGKALGSGAEAEEALGKAVAIRAGWAEGFQMLGRVLYLNGKYEEAEKALGKAAGLDPNLVEAKKYLGMCQYRTKRYAEAIATLGDVLVKVPNMAEAAYYLGLSHDAGNAYDKAEDAYKSAMSMDAKYADPVIALGYLFYRTGKPTSAMSTLEKGVAINPKSSLAWQVMGDIYSERQSWKKAKESYEKALGGDMADVDKVALDAKLAKAQEGAGGAK